VLDACALEQLEALRKEPWRHLAQGNSAEAS